MLTFLGLIDCLYRTVSLVGLKVTKYRDFLSEVQGKNDYDNWWIQVRGKNIVPFFQLLSLKLFKISLRKQFKK